MTDLTFPMNPMTFEQLFELGRAAIPSLSMRWTDHNTHDPGIMFIELLAWIAEAQMYSMARLRRNERQAYAKLLGVEPRGPVPARGLIWPSAVAWAAGQVIDADADVTGDRPDAPAFYTNAKIQLTTARLVKVETDYGNGVTHDWTRVNAQETATFMPFGAAPQPGVRLFLTFELASVDRPTAGIPISLGFEIDNPAGSPLAQSAGTGLQVSLDDANGERPLQIDADTTSTLRASGVLLLEAGTISPEAGRFRLIVQSATGGFARPPRVRRIGVNVLPVYQLMKAFDDVAKFGNAAPDQQYTLEQDGLIFEGSGQDAVKIRIAEGSAWSDWSMTENLATSGPADRHFELDTKNGILTFGNGINGRIVPAEVSLQASYRASLGSAGNLLSGVSWKVKGIQGAFGTNREATAGGQDRTTLDDLRDTSRIQFDTARPLVTSGDVQSEALSYTILGVKRAVELPISASRLQGDRVLVVSGPHDSDGSTPAAPLAEQPEFLEAIRLRIAPRLPLGQKLEVVAPAYVPVKITATLTAARNADPTSVQANAVAELQKRLAAVTANGLGQWPLGRPVSARSIEGWLRRVDGVARVQKVELRSGTGPAVPVIELGERELPDLQLSASDITVVRPAEGASR